MLQWSLTEITELYELPFFELINRAHQVLRENFPEQQIQLATLLSIKTGGCPEDCAYCPQSAHYQTGVKREKLLDQEQIVSAAKIAKENGADRFCMGAAWRSIPTGAMSKLCNIISALKEIEIETCLTAGMLTLAQAQQLKAAGLDYYNHNLDCAPDYYKNIISTRDYQDRLNTLKNVTLANINTCCGGIIGMGETRIDRIAFLQQLSRLTPTPTSIPINRLIPIPGTPLADAHSIDNLEFIRTIAVARIMFPLSRIRLSGSRPSMSEEMQVLCLFAGANSFFIGNKLLVTDNTDAAKDKKLLDKLQLHTINN